MCGFKNLLISFINGFYKLFLLLYVCSSTGPILYSIDIRIYAASELDLNSHALHMTHTHFTQNSRPHALHHFSHALPTVLTCRLVAFFLQYRVVYFLKQTWYTVYKNIS